MPLQRKRGVILAALGLLMAVSNSPVAARYCDSLRSGIDSNALTRCVEEMRLEMETLRNELATGRSAAPSQPPLPASPDSLETMRLRAEVEFYRQMVCSLSTDMKAMKNFTHFPSPLLSEPACAGIR
jgi:hypothetical protein